MNNDSRFMKALGTIQAICGWILTVSVGILSIFIAFVSPFRALFTAHRQLESGVTSKMDVC